LHHTIKKIIRHLPPKSMSSHLDNAVAAKRAWKLIHKARNGPKKHDISSGCLIRNCAAKSIRPKLCSKKRLVRKWWHLIRISRTKSMKSHNGQNARH
jgi:hypothetical protein